MYHLHLWSEKTQQQTFINLSGSLDPERLSFIYYGCTSRISNSPPSESNKITINFIVLDDQSTVATNHCPQKIFFRKKLFFENSENVRDTFDARNRNCSYNFITSYRPYRGYWESIIIVLVNDFLIIVETWLRLFEKEPIRIAHLLTLPSLIQTIIILWFIWFNLLPGGKSIFLLRSISQHVLFLIRMSNLRLYKPDKRCNVLGQKQKWTGILFQSTDRVPVLTINYILHIYCSILVLRPSQLSNLIMLYFSQYLLTYSIFFLDLHSFLYSSSFRFTHLPFFLCSGSRCRWVELC